MGVNEREGVFLSGRALGLRKDSSTHAFTAHGRTACAHMHNEYQAICGNNMLCALNMVRSPSCYLSSLWPRAIGPPIRPPPFPSESIEAVGDGATGDCCCCGQSWVATLMWDPPSPPPRLLEYPGPGAIPGGEAGVPAPPSTLPPPPPPLLILRPLLLMLLLLEWEISPASSCRRTP